MFAVAAGQFALFGWPHLVAMVVIAAVPAVLVWWARRASRPGLTRWICRSLAVVLVANEAGYWAAGAATAGAGQFLREFLPLHVCGVAVLLTAWVLLRPRQGLYEVAYYWGLAGTVQAILTPDLQRAFPSYWFFEYFISHGGIVAGVLVATLAMGMRPRPGSVLRVFLLTNAYMLLVAGANWLLDANYMFLCRPPTSATPLIFLPWPWYILFMEPVGLALCAAAYLPWFIRDRKGAGL